MFALDVGKRICESFPLAELNIMLYDMETLIKASGVALFAVTFKQFRQKQN